MTLEHNITAILESYFSGFKDELIEACTQRIMEQIERQADTPQTRKGYMWTCPKCGTENHSDFNRCPCCGYTPQTDCVGCEDSMEVWAETRPGVFEKIGVCGLDDCEKTDCAVITDTSYQVLDGWQTREKPKTTDCPWK